ncbi:hypothetical protein CO151_13275 [bacterium CG_4_9_14_3_um_filter_65_15]|nr:MAG: hypothetical protein CO151_13275 [bacterium CG_4_9_14_3_um_filter_65_15]
MTETGLAMSTRMMRRCAATLSTAWVVLFAWGALAAGPLYWDMPAGDAFSTCDLYGFRLTEEGFLAPGLPRDLSVALDGDIVWTMLPDGSGCFLLGTGHDGRVLSLDADGKTAVWADLDCEEVISLASLPDGRLVAGCEPGGQVFVIDAEGKPTLVAKIPDVYVWAIAADGAGRAFLATGSPARVMVLDTGTGKVEELLSLPAENTIDILSDDSGRLVVATQGPGLVYALDPDDPEHAEVLLQTPQDEIGSLVRGPQGVVFGLALDDGEGEAQEMATPPAHGSPARAPRPLVLLPGGGAGAEDKDPAKAALYSLKTGKAPKLVWSGDLDLMAVAWLEDLGWVAGGLRPAGSSLTTLHRLLPGGGQETLANWRGGDITALAAQGGKLNVAQTRACVVDRFGSRDRGPRVVTGPVLDAARPVAWGRLSWRGYPLDKSPRWSVRWGNRETPDATWTEWSSAWTDADHELKASAARFLQWRVGLPSGAGEDFRLTSVSVSAWGENRAPLISELRQERPQGVRLGGLLVQRPNLTHTFASGLKAEFSRRQDLQSPDPDMRSRLGRGVVVFTWSAEDPDHDSLEYRLECRQEGASDWRLVAEGLGDQLATWDTEEVADGIYTVRLTVSDEPDNPGSRALSRERSFGPVSVDNTAPDLTGLSAELKDGLLHIGFFARDAASPLNQAFLVLEEDRRIPLEPRDRICDSLSEEFKATYPLDADEDPPVTVRVEVTDTAGNLVSARLPLVRK